MKCSSIRFFYKSGEHSKALRHLLKYASTSQDDSEALNLAIEVVGTAPPNQPHLTRYRVTEELEIFLGLFTYYRRVSVHITFFTFSRRTLNLKISTDMLCKMSQFKIWLAMNIP